MPLTAAISAVCRADVSRRIGAADRLALSENGSTCPERSDGNRTGGLRACPSERLSLVPLWILMTLSGPPTPWPSGSIPSDAQEEALPRLLSKVSG